MHKGRAYLQKQRQFNTQIMMAITKQDIAAIVTIIVLNSLLYGNLVTTKAYAQGAQEWEEIMRLPPEQQLEAIEKYQQESQEASRNATIAGAQERQAEREQDRLAWPQQHQQAIQEMETAIQQAKINLNTTRQGGNEPTAIDRVWHYKALEQSVA